MSDLSALYTSFLTVLNDGTGIWAKRAFSDFAPPGTMRPYVLVRFAGGGDLTLISKPDPNLLIDVTCVADKPTDAYTADEQIRQRLDDGGEQEPKHTVIGDNEFAIKTITREMRIHQVQMVQGASQIYRSGARYRVQMEKR